MGSKLPGNLRQRKCRPGLDAEALLEALRAEAEPWVCLKRGDRSATYSAAISGTALGKMELVLKVRSGGGLGEALKAAAGASQLQRQWRGAELLTQADIPTAPGLALWTGKDGDGFVEIAAFERLPGTDLIRLQAAGDLDSRLAREAGRLAGQVLRAGLFNRDQKPSNLMALPDGRLAIIDTVGVRRLRPTETRRIPATDFHSPGAVMLAALMFESLGVGHPPRRAQRWRALQGFSAAVGLQDASACKALWRAVEERLEAHGDPTPKDSPL
jgi:hypothetical protein